jgi:hypothetical protein
VNEEGLLEHPQHFFMFEGGHQPLAGNGVILSLTDDVKGFGRRPEHERSIRYRDGIRKPPKNEPAGKR